MNEEVGKKVVFEVLKKAEEKLITAKIDFEHKRYEDSISRLYYCIYHAITAALLLKGLSFSSHKEVIGAFNKEFVKTGIFPSEFSKYIKVLFDDRQKSDYDIAFDLYKNRAKEDLKISEILFDKIKEYVLKTIK